MPVINHTLPVPAFLEHTARFVAGPVTIGVEYRVLDEAAILDVLRSRCTREVPQRRAGGYGRSHR